MSHEADHSGNRPSHLTDSELEQWLCDAYAVPPVPRNLRKRIDQSVAPLFGTLGPASAQTVGGMLGSAALGRKALGRKARARSLWQIGACAAVVLAIVVGTRGDAHAYSWSKVLEALGRQPVVQVGAGAERVRWLALSEGLLGESSPHASRLVDFSRGVVLRRRSSESRVTRQSLSDTTRSPAGAMHVSRDGMVLALLAGDSLEDNPGMRSAVPSWASLRVTDENWSRQADGVELEVHFRGDSASEALTVVFSLDQHSHLPRTYRLLADGTSLTRELTYPRRSTRELVAEVVPPGVTVADVEGEATFGGSAALSAESSSAVDVAAVDGASGTSDGGGPSVPLVGAASLAWEPVKARTLARDDVVRSVNGILGELWAANAISPAAEAGDAELLRRVYLDLAGRTPTVAEVRAYLKDNSPNRYERLVDRLLGSRDHATHLATVWRTFLIPEGVDLSRFGGTAAFDEWLSAQFGRNVPYDQLVRDLLLAEGRLTKSGPLLFYTAMKLDADQLAARTARVFLGMRLDCAQCHDDPFEPWTQQDFWSFAAFFARISRPQAKLENVSTVMRVRDIDRGEVMLPDTETVIPPQFLDGSSLDESPESADRRQQLARWLTGSENPYFAKAAVNRVWAHLFGVGIVDPVDGFGKNHAPRSPELLDLLAGYFVSTDFDLRELFRAIVLSRAYRLTSGSDTADANRQEWFAQMRVKTLTAEQIYDCITVASLLATQGLGDTGEFQLLRGSNSGREAFLQQFRTPSGRRTEYERGIPQALTLMNGTLISSATGLASSGLLKSLEAPFFTDDQRIEVLYLATLSRSPSPAEWDILRTHLQDREPAVSVQEPLADILWALLNSAEFTMNH